MDNPVILLLLAWFGMALIMVALWLVERKIKDASHVDVAWAAGLGLIATFYSINGTGDLNRRILLAVIVSVWSFRLAGYLLFNRVIGKPEDGRYIELRRKWGKLAARKFFVFFQFQAVIDAAFSIPFLVVAFNRHPGLRIFDYIGASIVGIAILGESLADRQLARFRSSSKNHGKTCRQGLWQYSRHPNYFFEWVHWFAYPLLAWGSTYFGFTLLGPILMWYFLFKITGIPPTEERALKTRVDYRDYQRTTSMFIPWFPKKSKRVTT